MIDGRRRAPTNVHGAHHQDRRMATRAHHHQQQGLTTRIEGWLLPPTTTIDERPRVCTTTNGHGCAPRRTATGAHDHDRRTANSTIDRSPACPTPTLFPAGPASHSPYQQTQQENPRDTDPTRPNASVYEPTVPGRGHAPWTG